jgi:membrane-bound ClpP family serine protease
MASPSPQPPPRFTLAGLFELIAAIALFLGLVVELGSVGFCIAGAGGIIVLTADYLILAQHRKKAWRNVTMVYALCFAILLVVLLFTCLLPAVQSARESSRRAQCSNNMRQIALAIHEYHDVHGHLPRLTSLTPMESRCTVGAC